MERLSLSSIRTDGGTQPRAQMDAVVIAEYAEAFSEGAAFPPVVVFHDGTDYWLADGFHRVAGARQAERPDIAADVWQGTRRDAVLFSVGANAQHGLRRTNEDKRRAVLALLNDDEWSKWSDREIARRAKVSPSTVGSLRESASVQVGQIERKVERNGTVYTMQTKRIGASTDTAERPPFDFGGDGGAEDAPNLSREAYTVDVDAEAAEASLSPEPAPSKMDVHYSSESPEWYTPEHIIELASDTLGGIDLDPASSALANEAVGAARYFTEETDGLAQEWTGKVWMNPPYGRVIAEWVEKLVAEYEAGRVAEAIALVPARTDTEWFSRFRPFVRCFIRGRLTFSGADASAPFPSVAVYLGPNTERFARTFAGVGDTYSIVEAG